MGRSALAGVAYALMAWAAAASSAPAQQPQPGNVLVVIADDVGVDRIAAYREHPDAGPTPVIDALAAQGVLFRNAYANPLCSPTRMTMLTGRYGFRTGVGTAYGWGELAPLEVVPDLHDTFVAELLGGAGYRTGIVGKWHLTKSGWRPDPFAHPILVGGFDTHLGAMTNVDAVPGFDYFHWVKNAATASGSHQTVVDHYATSENVDDALRLVQRWGQRRWMLWLAFNAAHSPYHVPPRELHSFDLAEDAPVPLRFRAAVEALDTELGRLLAGIPPDVLARTTILIVGDNGTPEAAMTAPMVDGHYKGTVYEGGIRVPLIASGYRVAAPGREVSSLVHTVDVFDTLLELTGATDPGTGIDSVSFLPYLVDPQAPPQRRFVFSEVFKPNSLFLTVFHDRAVRDERYKLIRLHAAVATQTQFFDLVSDPLEQHDLLPALTPEQQQAYLALSAEMDQLD